MNIFTFRGLFVLACIGAVALWFKPWVKAEGPGVGAVAGKAIDSDGRAVPGASIVLRDSKGVVVGRAESAGNGDFLFDNCKPGRYRLAAAKLGIGGGERNVLVDPRARADATIPLSGQLTGVGHR